MGIFSFNLLCPNLIIHNPLCRNSVGDFYHWHIEFMPVLARVAGFEWGTGFTINPISPRGVGAVAEVGLNSPRWYCFYFCSAVKFILFNSKRRFSYHG